MAGKSRLEENVTFWKMLLDETTAARGRWGEPGACGGLGVVLR